MNNHPKVPVRFLPGNDELLELQKSTSSEAGPTTDHKLDTAALTARMEPTYRTPADRVNGNCLFRRNPDGSLDLDYAKHKIVNAIHKAKDGMVLSSLEQTALSAVFPGTFSLVDSGVLPSVMAVNLKITPVEASMVALKVSEHLQAELEYMRSSHAR